MRVREIGEGEFLPDLRPLFAEAEVRAAISQLGTRIADRYAGETVCLLALLEGGAYLRDRLFIRLRNRGVGVTGTNVRVHRSMAAGVLGPPVVAPLFVAETLRHLEGAHVLLVDDICDEGQSLECIKRLVSPFARSVESAVVVDRTRSVGKVFTPTYAALTTDSTEWLVGCGMDLDGEYRELPYVGYVSGAPGLAQR
ncbi:MAG: hypothetical protein HY678_08015 [Chloroflexi bacterium]|nr:hypothetical protein [Chloroflexota bacterium]